MYLYTLLDETIEKITLYRHSVDDVAYAVVRTKDNMPVNISWDDFAKLSKDIRYDSGYGTQEVYEGAKIVFKDGSWLERREYDGSEWWHYCKPIEVDVKTVPLNDNMSIMTEWHDEKEEN